MQAFSRDLGMYVKIDGNNCEYIWVEDGSPGVGSMSHDLGVPVKMHDNGDGTFTRVVRTSGTAIGMMSLDLGERIAMHDNGDGTYTEIVSLPDGT